MEKIYCVGNPDYVHPDGEVVHHVDKIPDHFPRWLRNAKIKWCVVSLVRHQHVIWYDGIWYSGLWNNGTWYGGIWKNGTWWEGNWYNGTWRVGEWWDGMWHKGTWYNGVWISGMWRNKNHWTKEYPPWTCKIN